MTTDDTPDRLVYSFSVPGTAVPQGSKSQFRGRLVEARTVGPWREKVKVSARAALGPRTYPVIERGVPVGVELSFTMPAIARKRVWPYVRPDLDKLVRAVFDALTGVMFADDAQVCALLANKTYSDHERPPGVDVSVWAL